MDHSSDESSPWFDPTDTGESGTRQSSSASPEVGAQNLQRRRRSGATALYTDQSPENRASPWFDPTDTVKSDTGHRSSASPEVHSQPSDRRRRSGATALSTDELEKMKQWKPRYDVAHDFTKSDSDDSSGGEDSLKVLTGNFAASGRICSPSDCPASRPRPQFRIHNSDEAKSKEAEYDKKFMSQWKFWRKTRRRIKSSNTAADRDVKSDGEISNTGNCTDMEISALLSNCRLTRTSSYPESRTEIAKKRKIKIPKYFPKLRSPESKSEQSGASIQKHSPNELKSDSENPDICYDKSEKYECPSPGIPDNVEKPVQKMRKQSCPVKVTSASQESTNESASSLKDLKPYCEIENMTSISSQEKNSDVSCSQSNPGLSSESHGGNAKPSGRDSSGTETSSSSVLDFKEMSWQDFPRERRSCSYSPETSSDMPEFDKTSSSLEFPVFSAYPSGAEKQISPPQITSAPLRVKSGVIKVPTNMQRSFKTPELSPKLLNTSRSNTPSFGNSKKSCEMHVTTLQSQQGYKPHEASCSSKYLGTSPVRSYSYSPETSSDMPEFTRTTPILEYSASSVYSSDAEKQISPPQLSSSPLKVKSGVIKVPAKTEGSFKTPQLSPKLLNPSRSNPPSFGNSRESCEMRAAALQPQQGRKSHEASCSSKYLGTSPVASGRKSKYSGRDSLDTETSSTSSSTSSSASCSSLPGSITSFLGMCQSMAVHSPMSPIDKDEDFKRSSSPESSRESFSSEPEKCESTPEPKPQAKSEPQNPDGDVCKVPERISGLETSNSPNSSADYIECKSASHIILKSSTSDSSAFKVPEGVPLRSPNLSPLPGASKSIEGTVPKSPDNSSCRRKGNSISRPSDFNVRRRTYGYYFSRFSPTNLVMRQYDSLPNVLRTPRKNGVMRLIQFDRDAVNRANRALFLRDEISRVNSTPRNNITRVRSIFTGNGFLDGYLPRSASTMPAENSPESQEVSPLNDFRISSRANRSDGQEPEGEKRVKSNVCKKLFFPSPSKKSNSNPTLQEEASTSALAERLSLFEINNPKDDSTDDAASKKEAVSKRKAITSPAIAESPAAVPTAKKIRSSESCSKEDASTGPEVKHEKLSQLVKDSNRFLEPPFPHESKQSTSPKRKVEDLEYGRKPDASDLPEKPSPESASKRAKVKPPSPEEESKGTSPEPEEK